MKEIQRKRVRKVRKLNKRAARRESSQTFVHKIRTGIEQCVQLAFAHGVRRESSPSIVIPDGHVVVFLDGDGSNTEAGNLYCLPGRELTNLMNFARKPVEAFVDRLEKKIMPLDTSEAVKKELLGVLDQLVDKTQTPDIVRQRAICETVQTLVGLLKVEVTYIRTIEGDGVVPFLEAAHEEAIKRTTATKKALFHSPSPGHPWRGLGDRNKGG
jgi:hypothetical protein